MEVGEKGRGKNKGNTGQRDWSANLLRTHSGQSFSYVNAPEYEKKTYYSHFIFIIFFEYSFSWLYWILIAGCKIFSCGMWALIP